MDTAVSNQTERMRSAWLALHEHRAQLAGFDLARAQAQRSAGWTIEACGIRVDLTRHLATDATRMLLDHLAQAAELPAWREALFAGRPINHTEQRPAWHTALRSPKSATACSSLRSNCAPARGWARPASRSRR
jgi:glucose-6-phosphate isomerase